MKEKSNILVSFLKHITFVLLLFALFAKPFSQTVTFLSDIDYELLTIAFEHDIEEENKEIDIEDEKIEVQIVKPSNANHYEANYTTKFAHYCLSLCTYFLEIHSPPPKIP